MSIILDGPDGDLISRSALLELWDTLDTAQRAHFNDFILQAPTACRPDIMHIEVKEAGWHTFEIEEHEVHAILDGLGIVIKDKNKLDRMLGKDSSEYANRRLHQSDQGK